MDLPKLKAEILRFERLEGGGKNLPLRRWYNHVAEMKGGEAKTEQEKNYESLGLFPSRWFSGFRGSRGKEAIEKVRAVLLDTMVTLEEFEIWEGMEEADDYVSSFDTWKANFGEHITDKQAKFKAFYELYKKIVHYNNILHGLENVSNPELDIKLFKNENPDTDYKILVHPNTKDQEEIVEWERDLLVWDLSGNLLLEPSQDWIIVGFVDLNEVKRKLELFE